MNMKKVFALLTSVILMLSVLTACGDKKEPAETVDNTTPAVSAELPQSYELSSDAQTRADDAYAFIASLKEAASDYDAASAKYSYTLNCHDPADSAAGEFLYAWSDAVLAATKGDVYIEVGVSNAFSSGGTMATLDDMKNGMIDFDFTLPCYFKGYMPYTLAIQNPALGFKNSTAGAVTMWELYKSNSDVQAEYADDGEVMFVWANNPSPISYKGSDEISSISKIKGNIRANNGPAQMLVEELGASVYSCPIGEVYTNVTTGVIDYLITDWHAVKSFSLYDNGVLNHYIDTNAGSSAYTLMANSEVWATIEADGYADAIKSVSGDYCLNWIGIWEQYEIDARATALTNGGDIYAPSEAFAAELDTAYQAVAKTWVKDTGGNAQAVYDETKALADKYIALYQ